MVVAGAIVLGLSVCPVLRTFSQVQMHETLAAHGGQGVRVVVWNIPTKTGRWDSGFLVTLKVGG